MDTLTNNHAYHQPATDLTRKKHERVRELTLDLAKELVGLCPASRQLSVAQTKLEEVRMWANAAIACNDDAPMQQDPPADQGGGEESAASE